MERQEICQYISVLYRIITHAKSNWNLKIKSNDYINLNY